MTPATERVAWIVGLIAAAGAAAGITYVVTEKAASAAQPSGGGKPATQLVTGNVYRFSALATPGATDQQIAAALSQTFWQTPTVWLYGEPSTPTDYTWPAATQNQLGYLAQATWGGANINVPAGVFGVVDMGPATAANAPPPKLSTTTGLYQGAGAVGPMNLKAAIDQAQAKLKAAMAFSTSVYPNSCENVPWIQWGYNGAHAAQSAADAAASAAEVAQLIAGGNTNASQDANTSLSSSNDAKTYAAAAVKIVSNLPTSSTGNWPQIVNDITSDGPWPTMSCNPATPFASAVNNAFASAQAAITNAYKAYNEPQAYKPGSFVMPGLPGQPAVQGPNVPRHRGPQAA